MKTVTKIIEVYEFNELSESAKMKAINDYIKVMLEVIDYVDMSENMQRACNKAESMKTPWFVGSYVYDYCLDEIMENVNGYSYLIDGSIYIDN